MSTTPVPIELVEYTLVIAKGLDTRTLRSCSVAHSCLTALCQRQLFKSVRVNGSRWDRLIALLEASPQLCPYIQHLTLWDFDDRNALPLDTARLTTHMMPRVATVLCNFNVQLKSAFFVKLPALESVIIGANCTGPLRLNHSHTAPARVRLQRLHITRPFHEQDQLLRWVQTTASLETLRSVRLFFAPNDTAATVSRAVRVLGQMSALDYLLLDVSQLAHSLDLPGLAGSALPTPHLCIKAKASDRTVPIVLGLLQADLSTLRYLAIWLVNPSGRAQLGSEIGLQQTYDAWAIAPTLAAQLERVKVVLEDCRIVPAELAAFCRLFRVHDLPGIMDVCHASRERIAFELAGFV